MADIRRKAQAEWNGDLRGGKGRVSTDSGVLKDQRYSFTTRFENEPGTNPEELIAAAHAACLSMALSNALAKEGYQPESVQTTAVCIMTDFKIRKMELNVRARVPGIDNAAFQKIAQDAGATCPVSTLLKQGMEVEVQAELV